MENSLLSPVEIKQEVPRALWKFKGSVIKHCFEVMIKIDVSCKRNFLVLCVSMCINLFVDIIVAQQERKIKARKKKLVLNEIERHRTNSLKNYNSQNNLDTFMLLFSCVVL